MSANKRTKKEMLELIECSKIGFDVMQEVRQFLSVMSGLTKKELYAYLLVLVQSVDRLGDKEEIQNLQAIIEQSKGQSRKELLQKLEEYFVALQDTIIRVLKNYSSTFIKANNKTVF